MRPTDGYSEEREPGARREKYNLQSTMYKVSKATATAQDAHTFNFQLFPSPLVGRNNIGRGVSPERGVSRG